MSDDPNDSGNGSGGAGGGGAAPGRRAAGRRGLDLAVDPAIGRGAYANVAIIAHTANEFVLDFALAAPGQRPVLTSRVVTSPAHAKALLRSLADNLRRFEDRHGTIGEPLPPAASGDDEHN